MPKLPVIDSFADLHAFASAPGFRGAIFRGVGDAAHHTLVPSVGRVRPQGFRATDDDYEQATFRAFKRLAVPHLTFNPRSDWEWLALAQHHGLATRLLDWSYNPLVAAFFAVESDADTDAAIYVATQVPMAPDGLDPFAVTHVLRYTPSHVTPRIFSQKGTFTVHPEPSKPYSSSRVSKALISRRVRFRLRDDLYRYGISRGSMFPGLDGLAAELGWRYAFPFSGTHAKSKANDALRRPVKSRT